MEATSEPHHLFSLKTLPLSLRNLQSHNPFMSVTKVQGLVVRGPRINYWSHITPLKHVVLGGLSHNFLRLLLSVCHRISLKNSNLLCCYSKIWVKAASIEISILLLLSGFDVTETCLIFPWLGCSCTLSHTQMFIYMKINDCFYFSCQILVDKCLEGSRKVQN